MNEPADDFRDDEDVDLAETKEKPIKPYVQFTIVLIVFLHQSISSGACARCKNLKVRCEFKTDTDPCKRCLNGGHECVIPGRKKRRTPPYVAFTPLLIRAHFDS